MIGEQELAKRRREQLRWLILSTLNAARPIGATESLVMDCVDGVLKSVTRDELRRELDYLESRKLIAVRRDDTRPRWEAKLTRHGADVAEYTVPCEPGIARPTKYW